MNKLAAVLALFAIAYSLGYATPSFADGSDPMPICRKVVKSCLP